MAPLTTGGSVLLILATAIISVLSTAAAAPTIAPPTTVMASLSASASNLLIHEDREYLKYCMEEIRKKCKEYGFVLNEKKTKIAPLRKGVKFLKTKFFLNETGAIIRKMNRKSPVKMRKKLRIFRRWIDEGRFTITDVETAYQSWRGHMIRGNSTLVLRKMDAFYNSLFKNKEDSGHGKVSEERQLARAC